MYKSSLVFISDNLDGYSVDTDGNVWSKLSGDTEHTLKPRVSNMGYARVRLGGKEYSVHRLVAFAFVEGYSSGKMVNHLNGDKLDNRAENLEWCTASENVRHYHNVVKKTLTST